MTWFNKFIAFISLTAIMLLGVLAIHSIKVDTLPIDYSLGLISKNRNPLFTIKAKAIGDCVGSCFSTIDGNVLRGQQAAIEAARQATSQTIGGILNMIKATLKAVMKVIQMIKKVLNFIISLLQKFSGRDISLYGILSAVQDLSKINNPFNSFQNEFNQIWTDYGKDIQSSQAQIALGQENIAKVSNIYNACIAVSLMQENGENPNVDRNALCNLAINSKVALGNAIAYDKIKGPNGTSAVSTVLGSSNTIASSQTLNSDGSTTTSATAESSVTIQSTPVVGPLNFLFGQDPGTTRYAGLTEQANLTKKIADARTIDQNKKKQAEDAQKFSPGCGPYIGAADKNLAISTNPNAVIKGFTAAPIGASVFSAGSDVSIGVAPASANYSFAKVSDFQQKAFTPEQCSNVQDSAKTTETSINQANQTTASGETSGGIAQVVSALQSAFEVIQTIQQIFQQIMGFINEIMSVGQSFMSEFGGFMSSIGNVFGQAGAGGASQAGILSAAINNTSAIAGAGGAGNLAVLDDGSLTINDASISANVENIQKYSDLSIDCVKDAVKVKSVDFTNQYRADINATFNPDALPVVGSNNIKTYTNGSNVPDGVMGASVNDSNTPGMAGITYRKTDGTTGTVPTTPAKSLITSGAATGNINATYHQCQSSPWSDDNSVDTAAKRLAYYPADPKYGGPSAYRDGVSNDWRVVNNLMSKDIPDQCYLTNNDLSGSDKQSIIAALGINYGSFQGNPNDSSALDRAWQEAKTRVDQAQRDGKARWDSDPNLIYTNRVKDTVTVGDKAVPIKPGRCEVSYTKDQVNASLQNRGWSFNVPEVKSFVKLVPGN